MKVAKRDIELLYELGCIRFIPRMWKRFFNGDFANLAEHHFHVTWIALVIAGHEGVQSTDKIMKMALVHDIAESRTGDVDYLARQYTERNEELGLKDMLSGTIFEDEMLALWQEYEAHESIEAKIVKDADILDQDFEMQEQIQKGVSFGGDPEHWRKVRKNVYDLKLSTNTAKAMWRALQIENPQDWHVLGRNRYNSGDWHKSS